MESLLVKRKFVDREDSFKKVNSAVIDFIASSDEAIQADELFWYDTCNTEDLNNLPSYTRGLGSVQKINNATRINKFLEKVNISIDNGDYLALCMEDFTSRKVRLFSSYPKIFRRITEFSDFLINRVLPKLSLTKGLYFKLKRNNYRVLSQTEILGRLVSCGFRICGHQKIGFETYILAKKVDQPKYDLTPTYGALVTLNRVGLNGELLNLYKVRTMHPYSEYLQEYLFEKNGTKDGDKIVNDYRVTKWGEIFRKFWIDELPMIWHWLKGDLKLVGVRPLSQHKFYTYPKDLQEKRTKIKPGLVPPYYADMPQTPEEFFQSEDRYLDSYLKNPLKTDFKYFFKALYNIFICKARSH